MAYDVLFEPVRIGPLTTRNRFFQVPHCNGMGHRHPRAHAEMRRVKAEGGWAVVCTEEVEIHHSSDLSPYVEGRLWDDADIPAHALVTEAIHAEGALAGIELAHNGMHAANLYTRLTPLGPGHLPVRDSYDPVQARAMTAEDLADLRRWHRAAVRRSLQAGYDLVYVYAGHSLTTIQHFLSPRFNRRTDEYGGTLANRARLLREILEETGEEVAGRAAVACRLAVDELVGAAGLTRAETEDLLGELGELPDLWDLTVGEWEDDSVTSRFGPEGDQEQYVAGLKQLTTKPVVGVGRFTSPDQMVRQVRAGILDLIGAARPSIADPFLPNKLRDGRPETVRECIGCNVCVSGDYTMTPIRCTQNPSMGEEFRRGWHPERIRPAGSAAQVMVVGAGPAGLEAARALGQRGYQVLLVEASRELGGRVVREAALPGLAAWRRVVDHREQAIGELTGVQVFRQSELTAEEIAGSGAEHVAVATGSRWRRDGVARRHTLPIPVAEQADVLTPDDLMAGLRPRGPRVVLYDDDHYYLGGVLAELLVREGFEVDLVTPAATVSAWTVHTMEQGRITRRLLGLGVRLRTDHAVAEVHGDHVVLENAYTDDRQQLPADSVLLVTARLPLDELYLRLADQVQAGRLASVQGIGDAWAPGTIAAAVWSGRRYAEELDTEQDRDAVPFRRELIALAGPPGTPGPAGPGGPGTSRG